MATVRKGRRKAADDGGAAGEASNAATGPPSFGRHRRDTLYGFMPTTLPDVKQVFVHVNGDAHKTATSFVVHPRRIRTYEMFLNDLTDKMRPGFGAVRHVYTPVNGSRVRDLEDLENHQRYVIAGPESFRRLRYADIDVTEAKRRTNRNSAKPPQREMGRISKSNRRRPYGWEPVHIFVYQNGDDVTPPIRISVRRAELDNWEHLMLRIGDKLDKSGFVKRLYNLNGDWVRGPKGVKNGQYYVAVGGYDSFKQVMYGKLLERLPQEFLGESMRKQKPRVVAKTNTNLPRKIVPKIKAPPSVYRKLKPKATVSNDKNNNSSNNSNNNTRNESKVIKKKLETTAPSRRVRKMAVKSKLPKIPEEPIKKAVVAVSKPPPLPSRPHVGGAAVGSKLTQSKRIVPPADREQPRRKEPPSTVKQPPPTRKAGAGGADVIRSVDDVGRQGKSPPDSDDSAYMSENEKRERRNGQKPNDDPSPSRPKSFRLIEDRPLPPPNTNDIYYATDIDKKQSQKRVTLVDYDQDASGVYRAKPTINESEARALEVQELENVPIELPIDEVEAEEVGEYSEEDEDDDENETKVAYYKRSEGSRQQPEQQHRYRSVAHSEADLRSSAATVS